MSLYVDSAANRVCSGNIKRRCWTLSWTRHIQGWEWAPCCPRPLWWERERGHQWSVWCTVKKILMCGYRSLSKRNSLVRKTRSRNNDRREKQILWENAFNFYLRSIILYASTYNSKLMFLTFLEYLFTPLYHFIWTINILITLTVFLVLPQRNALAPDSFLWSM